MTTIQNQNYLFQGPFTNVQSSNKKLIKTITVKGDLQELFLSKIKEETDLQKQLASNHPKYVMPILDLQITKGLFLNDKLAKIKYDCDSKCLPILVAVKELSGSRVIERKKELCLKLFEIGKWILTNKITHGNLKPSNILYYEGQVLLTDFGSERTFYQNYLADFTSKSHKEWQEQYYFYVTKEYLEIFKNSVDLDFRRDELKDWSNLQYIDYLIESDLWAIGLIILEIFCSKEDIIKKEIDCKDIKKVISQYYGLNSSNLNKALNIFRERTDEKLYEALKNLLAFDYLNAWKIIPDKDQVQPSSVSVDSINIGMNNTLPLQTQKLTSIKNFHQLNLSMINFSRVFCEQQEIIQTLESDIEELGQKIHETIKTTKLFIFDVVNELTKNEEIQSKQFISHQSLIYMNKQELEQYKQQILDLNENQIKKDNNLEAVNLRLKALALFDTTLIEENFQQDLIFYLNDQEYEKLLQNPLYYVNLSEQIQKYKTELSQNIYKFICERKNNFKFDDYQFLNINVLQYDSNNGFIQNFIQDKDRSLKQNGIEDFKFNESLKLFNKCERFIKNGELKDLIKDFKQFEKVGQLQQEYKKKLLQQINNQQFPQEMREQYEQAFFEIYEKLNWELEIRRNIRIYKQFDDLMNEFNIHAQIHPFILYIFNQKIELLQDKFKRKDEIYLRKFDQKKISLKQNIQNQSYKSQYFGQVINDIPYGFGFTIFEKKFIQFGIYQNKKLIQGWSLKLVSNITSQDQIFFDEGQFLNGLLNGEGLSEEIFIKQKSQGIDYKTYKQKKGLFSNNKLKGEGTYKIEDFEGIKFEERKGKFIQDNLDGFCRIYYDIQYQHYREGQFENGKQIGQHYEYKIQNGRQVTIPKNPPTDSCMMF